GLTSAQRRRNWLSVANGDAEVVVGARSALFLPLVDIGLLIVDEEHDGGFKQEDGTLYHARDVAIARARIEQCPVILASATPSVETAFRAGAIAGSGPAHAATQYCSLPARHGGARMPLIDLIDLRRDRLPRGQFISHALQAAISETLSAGQQVMLFLNRRGYAPLTICRACGFRFCCPNCSAWMIEHRFRGRLICHHCGYVRPLPEYCPECGAIDSLAGSGPGVERIAEEASNLFPDAQIAVMASDTVRSPKAAAQLIDAMQSGKMDILVGTQIIAKGHHFPNLTLVGVVDADVGLTGGDLRAGERCFQLLYQVAGRAGREAKSGRVLIQTHMPEHPVMQALRSGDRDGFLQIECEERRAAGMPPFGRLAALIVAGADGELVKQTGRRLASAAPKDDNVYVLGPAPAPLSLLRGRYRVRLLAKANEEIDLPAWVRQWLRGVRIPSRVHLQIDMDPISFL
ncbi:MAG: primosomal protein N', partial [Pseudomonadota bacterium]